ncbi:PucR family transcriptional regulator [Nonomuraea sp. PA05]|nr:PucR family transcriptional regulator [Nonomuraea sp. PA05]
MARTRHGQALRPAAHQPGAPQPRHAAAVGQGSAARRCREARADRGAPGQARIRPARRRACRGHRQRRRGPGRRARLLPPGRARGPGRPERARPRTHGVLRQARRVRPAHPHPARRAHRRHPPRRAAPPAGGGPKGEQLAVTLEAFLDNAGDVQLTAEQMFVHRTTLYYRLQRIEELTGVQLASGEDRLAFHLGLKVARLLGRLDDQV